MSSDLTINRFQTGSINASTALQELTGTRQVGTGTTLPPAVGDMTLNNALEQLGLAGSQGVEDQTLILRQIECG